MVFSKSASYVQIFNKAQCRCMDNNDTHSGYVPLREKNVNNRFVHLDT